MSCDFYELGEGYLYSLWNGKLKEYKGRVIHSDKYIYQGYIYPDKTYFECLDDNGKRYKKLSCSYVEGHLYNKVVWLSKSDKSKAAKILIDYEETQISKLKFQISNHEKLIDTLMKEIES